MDQLFKTTQDWGDGMLMTAREYREIRALDEAFGLRELRAKVNGNFNVGQSLKNPNQFSINAEFCYGEYAVSLVKHYLESGVLRRYVEAEVANDRDWSGADAYRHVTLLACCLTLGASVGIWLDVLRKTKKPMTAIAGHLEGLVPGDRRSDLAIKQFQTAMGTPPNGCYDFGNKTRVECFMAKAYPSASNISFFPLITHDLIVIEEPAPKGLTISMHGPLRDGEVGLENVKVFHASVCGNCGNSTATGKNKHLMACARCNDRRYCSRACQKKHWKLHKIICTIPKDEMASFMSSLPNGLKNADDMSTNAMNRALGFDKLKKESGKTAAGDAKGKNGT